jgi:hypothetical protein
VYLKGHRAELLAIQSSGELTLSAAEVVVEPKQELMFDQLIPR